MPRWNIDLEKEVAKKVINSKWLAEIFIKRYMQRHNADRENAIKKLEDLGIELSTFPDRPDPM